LSKTLSLSPGRGKESAHASKGRLWLWSRRTQYSTIGDDPSLKAKSYKMKFNVSLLCSLILQNVFKFTLEEIMFCTLLLLPQSDSYSSIIHHDPIHTIFGEMKVA
jgi:hypothetical protein